MWLVPARPRGPSALGRNWGAHPGQPHAGSSCFPALRAKGLYTDKPFAPLTTSVSINKRRYSHVLSAEGTMWVSVQPHPPHFGRNQESGLTSGAEHQYSIPSGIWSSLPPAADAVGQWEPLTQPPPPHKETSLSPPSVRLVHIRNLEGSFLWQTDIPPGRTVITSLLFL